MDAYNFSNEEIRNTITTNPNTLFTVDDITNISCSDGYQNTDGENTVTYTCPVNEGSFSLTSCEAKPCFFQVDIVINNVVCSFSVRCHLNLKEIAMNGSNVEYR